MRWLLLAILLLGCSEETEGWIVTDHEIVQTENSAPIYRLKLWDEWYGVKWKTVEEKDYLACMPRAPWPQCRGDEN